MQLTCFWGAEGAPILFSDLGLRMASCSYIYIYIYELQVRGLGLLVDVQGL